MPENEAVWEAYAIRYAHHHREACENFIGGDPHDTSPMPIDYFVWALRSGNRVIVIDTGFEKAAGEKRGRQTIHAPVEGLERLGVNPESVEDVVITHMHYDHSGNHDIFPNAKYHLQDREMAYCTGRYMSHAWMRVPFDPDDVAAMVRKLYCGRVEFHDGDEPLAPGITLHRVGGHSAGLQMVLVNTRRGKVLLASDAAHYYANLDRGLSYPFVFHVGDTLEGFRRARQLAGSPDHIVPGHDPLVLERYPAASPELKDWIVRLD